LYTTIYMKKVKNNWIYMHLETKTGRLHAETVCSLAHRVMGGFITYFSNCYNKKSFIYLWTHTQVPPGRGLTIKFHTCCLRGKLLISLHLGADWSSPLGHLWVLPHPQLMRATMVQRRRGQSWRFERQLGTHDELISVVHLL